MHTKLTLLFSTAALLGMTPAAFADTTVSLRNGNFGPGLNGDYVNVTDTFSPFGDKRMDVEVSFSSTGQIKVTDAVGIVHANGSGCTESGAAVLCNANGLEGLRIEGSDRNDVLTNSTDLVANILGDNGDDVLQGGSADEKLNGEKGDDIANGGAGNDDFFHEAGDDLFNGQAGTSDTVSYSGAPSAVDVTLTDDVQFDDGIAGEPDRTVGVENVLGSAFNDSLTGTDVRNIIRGRAGQDTLRGLDGNDFLDGETGPDDMGGGPGDEDTVSYETRSAATKVTLDSNIGDGESGENDNVRNDVEILEGGSGDDNFTGQAAAITNTFHGNAGKDTLDGAAGDDVISGGPNDDKIIGDIGTDDYDGGFGVDTLDYSKRSGEFSEDITLTLDNATHDDDGGASDGPAGARDDAQNMEGAITGDGADSVTGDASSETISTGLGTDTVVGNSGADTITTGPFFILAGAALDNDTVDSGLGDDKIFTGAGADTIDAAAGADFIDAGSGKDAVAAGPDNDELHIADHQLDEPVSCGSNDFDTAFVDQVDFATSSGQVQLQDCDSVTIQP